MGDAQVRVEKRIVGSVDRDLAKKGLDGALDMFLRWSVKT